MCYPKFFQVFQKGKFLFPFCGEGYIYKRNIIETTKSFVGSDTD